MLEALTIAAPCAATEWLEDDDDSNASARAGTAIVIGQIIGAVGWAVAADFGSTGGDCASLRRGHGHLRRRRLRVNAIRI